MSHGRVITVFLIVLGLSAVLSLTGCGSADVGEYEHEVAGINEAAAAELEEISHHLHAGGHGTEEETSHAVADALAESVMALKEILAGLEDVKVPAGMEDFHHALVGSWHAVVALQEELAAMLAPGGADAHSEGEEHGEDMAEEAH